MCVLIMCPVCICPYHHVRVIRCPLSMSLSSCTSLSCVLYVLIMYLLSCVLYVCPYHHVRLYHVSFKYVLIIMYVLIMCSVCPYHHVHISCTVLSSCTSFMYVLIMYVLIMCTVCMSLTSCTSNQVSFMCVL